MSNTKKREYLASLRKKYRNVESKRDSYVDRRDLINAKLNSEYHIYLQFQNKRLTSNENKRNSTKEDGVYLYLENELAELNKKIEISERLLSIWSEKMEAARAENIKDSILYNRDNLKPDLRKLEKSKKDNALDFIKQRLRGLIELIAVFGSIYLLIAIMALYPYLSTLVIMAIIFSFLLLLFFLK